MSGRGKELKGQTLVIPGSRSGASTVVTELAYDTAFNLEFIGEARYGSATTDQYWYIEKLTYDTAFNLIRIQTAQNQRLLGTDPTQISGTTITIPDGTFIFDISPNDKLNNIDIVSVSERIITLASALPATNINAITVTLEDYTTKDFNKRAWDLRELYIYA